MPWVGLLYVIVVVPDYTHLFFSRYIEDLQCNMSVNALLYSINSIIQEHKSEAVLIIWH